MPAKATEEASVPGPVGAQGNVTPYNVSHLHRLHQV